MNKFRVGEQVMFWQKGFHEGEILMVDGDRYRIDTPFGECSFDEAELESMEMPF